MKIAISTFNSSKNNYGALFQAHALSGFLSQMGYDVQNVTVERRPMKQKSIKRQLKIIAKSVLLRPMEKTLKTREKKFKIFAAETQNQVRYPDFKALKSNPPEADVYLAGSDQVWNPVAMLDDLFLAYAPEGAHKISYAASMGDETIPQENLSQFAEWIGEYAAVSVREDTVAKIISQFTDKPVHQHIDPVFLKSREEWELLEKKYEKLKFSRYILAYVIDWNEKYNQQLATVKLETGLPVVSVNIGNIKKICSDQIVYDASPNEFLYLLHHCEAVVATSFHGVAMSIVYNKRFLALVGKSKPTRIESLMRHFRIDLADSLQYTVSDFERINQIIVQDREDARNYFKEAVENG